METPWGRWSVLAEGEGFKVKLLEVEPGQRLSLQRHDRRSEHWVVASGTAVVTIGQHTYPLEQENGAFVTAGRPHRIANESGKPVLIVETQYGDYLGEDDIYRLEDDYDRA